MTKGYKVRLGDGSEIGPMDLDTLRGWYVQGLISRESPVMLPGTSRWTTLGETSEIRAFKSGSGRPSSPRRPAPSQRPAARPASPQSRTNAGPRGRAQEPQAGREMPWGIILGVLVLVVAGGAAYLLFAPGAEEKAIRAFAQPDRKVVDPATGLTLEAPAPWVVLRKEQNLVGAPAEAKAVLAQPKKSAYAYVMAERNITTAEAFLDEVIEARKSAVPSLAESGRSDRTLGKTAVRQSLAAFESGGKRFQGVALAGQEGGTAFALVGWEPDRGGPPQEVLRLVDGLTVTPPKVAGLEEALQVAASEVPYLSSIGAQLVMAQSAAQVLEPDETFRRSLQYMGPGLKALTPKEQQEVGELNRTVYGFVAQRDRWKMAAYIDRVRAKATTSTADTRRNRELMRDAVLKLPAPKRARLQQLYEAAIRKGIAASS
jgi:hypothetical protein